MYNVFLLILRQRLAFARWKLPLLQELEFWGKHTKGAALEVENQFGAQLGRWKAREEVNSDSWFFLLLRSMRWQRHRLSTTTKLLTSPRPTYQSRIKTKMARRWWGSKVMMLIMMIVDTKIWWHVYIDDANICMMGGLVGMIVWFLHTHTCS